jgi:hypothetical protein
VLITLGAASFYPPDFGLTRTLNAGRTSVAFYAPGPVVEMEIAKAGSPIFYGYEGKKVAVRYANGPLFAAPEKDKERWTLAKFNGTGLSGLLRGSGEIKDKAAILSVPTGKGKVVLFGTNPCYRWQNHGEFGMLFNAILHFNDGE